jgi:disulfide bond formation protein DsbB
MSISEPMIGRSPVVNAATAVAVGGAAAIVGAWFFQFVVGLAPCPLCLQQRWPYYVAIPLAVAVAVGARRGMPRGLLLAGLALIIVLLLVTAGLGAYHAGVEWHWWQGPQDCAASGASSGGGGSLLEQMKRARVVRCDEAAWRDPVLQLSLAGWNVLIALALAALALSGLVSALRRKPA